jgi:hypothetical protein
VVPSVGTNIATTTVRPACPSYVPEDSTGGEGAEWKEVIGGVNPNRHCPQIFSMEVVNTSKVEICYSTYSTPQKEEGWRYETSCSPPT